VFADAIRDLPDGAELPDLSELSLADRFGVALQLVPTDRREAVLGRSAKQLARYSHGTELPLIVVDALARETHLPLAYIVSGRPMARDGDASSAAFTVDRLSTNDDVALPKLAFAVSAGMGAVVIDPPETEFMHFPRSQLAHSGVRTDNARLMEARGESMVPTINDGDLLLVDVSDLTIAEGKVYVFSIGEEIFVKRLRKVGSRIMIRADNQSIFPGEEAVPEDQPFRVHGRVKWAGRNL
jgi:Peptidase S24-like